MHGTWSSSRQRRQHHSQQPPDSHDQGQRSYAASGCPPQTHPEAVPDTHPQSRPSWPLQEAHPGDLPPHDQGSPPQAGPAQASAQETRALWRSSGTADRPTLPSAVPRTSQTGARSTAQPVGPEARQESAGGNHGQNPDRSALFQENVWLSAETPCRSFRWTSLRPQLASGCPTCLLRPETSRRPSGRTWQPHSLPTACTSPGSRPASMGSHPGSDLRLAWNLRKRWGSPLPLRRAQRTVTFARKQAVSIWCLAARTTSSSSSAHPGTDSSTSTWPTMLAASPRAAIVRSSCLLYTSDAADE